MHDELILCWNAACTDVCVCVVRGEVGLRWVSV